MTARSTSSLWILAATSLVVLLTIGAWVGVRGCGGQGSETESDEGGSSEGGSEIDAVRFAVRGKVSLESIDPPEGPTTAPSPGTCSAQLWAQGKPVSEQVICSADGSFEVRPANDLEGPAALEVWVPGRLRGLLELAPLTADLELGEIALGIGVELHGQVVDTRGRGVADVEVQARPSPDLDESEPWRATADAEGRFRFDTLPWGPVDLRAATDRHGVGVVEAVAPETGVILVLEELVDLRGAVVGDPQLLARARVRVEGSSIWPPLEATIDESGQFKFERVTDGVYGLEVVVPATSPGDPEWASVPLENITPEMRVTLSLVEAGRAAVRVVDVEGRAIAGARVTLAYGEIAMLQRLATTNHDGKVEVGPVAPGNYILRADADGFLAGEAVEVTLTRGLSTEHTLVIARPAKIAGRVVDELDRPVVGADIRVEGELVFSPGEAIARAEIFTRAISSGGSLGVTKGAVPDIPLGAIGSDDLEVSSGTRGEFVIEGLVPGAYRVFATHGEHAASAVQLFDLRSGELRENVVLKLRRGSRVSGRVHDGNGRPISRATVTTAEGAELLTDDKGVFDLGRHSGKLVLVIRAPGMVPQKITWTVGAQDLDREIELADADSVLRGRIVDGNGRPISGVLVTLRPTDGLSSGGLVITDDRGTFEFLALSPGTADFELRHPNYVEFEAKVMVGKSDERDWLLDEGWHLDLRVRATGSGEPVVAASVRVVGEGEIRTTAEGRARLSRLGADEIRLEIRADGFVPASRVALRAGGSELLIELEPSGRLEGRVTDDLGDPVSGARLRLRGSAGVQVEVKSDAKGRFGFSNLAPGEVEIEALPPKALAELLRPGNVAAMVEAGETTLDVQIRFERL